MRSPLVLRVDVALKSSQFLETLVEHPSCIFCFLGEQRCSPCIELGLLFPTLVSEVKNLNNLLVSSLRPGLFRSPLVAPRDTIVLSWVGSQSRSRPVFPTGEGNTWNDALSAAHRCKTGTVWRAFWSWNGAPAHSGACQMMLAPTPPTWVWPIHLSAVGRSHVAINCHEDSIRRTLAIFLLAFSSAVIAASAANLHPCFTSLLNCSSISFCVQRQRRCRLCPCTCSCASLRSSTLSHSARCISPFLRPFTLALCSRVEMFHDKSCFDSFTLFFENPTCFDDLLVDNV